MAKEKAKEVKKDRENITLSFHIEKDNDVLKIIKKLKESGVNFNSYVRNLIMEDDERKKHLSDIQKEDVYKIVINCLSGFGKPDLTKMVQEGANGNRGIIPNKEQDTTKETAFTAVEETTNAEKTESNPFEMSENEKEELAANQSAYFKF